MDCFSDSLEEEIKEKRKKQKLDLIYELRHKIIQFLFHNPFYQVNVKDFRKFLKILEQIKIQKSQKIIFLIILLMYISKIKMI